MARDPVKLKAKRKRHYRRHREDILTKRKTTYPARREEAIAAANAWNAAHPDKVRAKKRRQNKNARGRKALAELEAVRASARGAVFRASLLAHLAGKTTRPNPAATPAAAGPACGYAGTPKPKGF